MPVDSTLSKSTRINSLKSASLEAISEIISDLCSIVSFIVLCLILKVTTNIRTLELTHVLGTVSKSRCSTGEASGLSKISAIRLRSGVYSEQNRLRCIPRGNIGYVFSHFTTKGGPSSRNLTALAPMGIIGRSKAPSVERKTADRCACAASAVGFSHIDEEGTFSSDFDVGAERHIERALPQSCEIIEWILQSGGRKGRGSEIEDRNFAPLRD